MPGKAGLGCTGDRTSGCRTGASTDHTHRHITYINAIVEYDNSMGCQQQLLHCLLR
jgi:hypothetical protein